MDLMSSLMSLAAACTSLIFSSVVFFPAAVACSIHEALLLLLF